MIWIAKPTALILSDSSGPRCISSAIQLPPEFEDFTESLVQVIDRRHRRRKWVLQVYYRRWCCTHGTPSIWRGLGQQNCIEVGRDVRGERLPRPFWEALDRSVPASFLIRDVGDEYHIGIEAL